MYNKPLKTCQLLIDKNLYGPLDDEISLKQINFYFVAALFDREA